jgi:type III restriction enzyme
VQKQLRLAVEIVVESNDDDDVSTPKLTKKQQAEYRTVDTVGKRRRTRRTNTNVISVGMLSEGWDAKTAYYTCIFKSIVLCEQVVGRGSSTSELRCG